MEWLNRMKAALDLMETMIEEPINMEEIAKAAYTSPYHFQRVFYALTGMTVADYIRRRRLTLAAKELALSGTKVIDAALKYGYESPESFSKAFRKLHGISPSEARQPGVQLKAFPRLTFHFVLKGDQEMEYRIVQREAFRTVGKSIRTAIINGENSKDIPKFWRDTNADGTGSRISALGKTNDILGVCYDAEPNGERFKYAIAVETDVTTAEDGLEFISIPAATWAVFTSVGPMPGAIQETWGRIYQEWFPNSGYVQAEGPDFELYPAGDTNSADYRCEVWIPIVKG